jgi:hypothetical protein
VRSLKEALAEEHILRDRLEANGAHLTRELVASGETAAALQARRRRAARSLRAGCAPALLSPSTPPCRGTPSTMTINKSTVSLLIIS